MLLPLQPMRELGPVSGWRCVQSPVYVYVPSHDRADRTLLADLPEATVMRHAPGAEIDRVETDLRGGDTIVWSRALGPDGGLDDARVFVLAPGRLQTTTPCNSHLGDWKIVGEHDLG